MKIASLTVDEIVKLRVALNNAQNTLERLIKSDESWKTIYEIEVEQVKEAKNILTEIIKRG